MRIESVREQLADRDPELMLADGYDAAIIAVGNQYTKDDVVIYDKEKVIQICMEQNEWDREEAEEWLEFNTFTAWMGDRTPMFVEVLNGSTTETS